jgi:hypothetical protein
MKLKIFSITTTLLCLNFVLLSNTVVLTKSQTSDSETTTEAEQEQLDEQEEELQEGEEAEIDDFAGLRAELNQYTQNPGSKEVKFEMVLESNIDSDRVRVTWELKGRSVFAEHSDPVVEMLIEKGQTYTIPITVIPTSKGVTELYGKVQSYELGNSFVVTVRKNYASNEAGEILPISDSYKQAKLQHTFLNLFKYLVLILIAIGSAFLGLKALKSWYGRDDVKAYDAARNDM